MAIRGITVKLYETKVIGKDEFNRDIEVFTVSEISNVVVGQPSSEDITSEISVSGKRIAYVLAIPAGDTHTWEGNVVEFYGRKWRTIGIPTQYMEGFMGKDFPWNKKIGVEAYE